MGFVASHLYRHATSGIQSETIEHLEELAKLKADEITRYFEQLKTDLVSAEDFVLLRTNIPILLALKEHQNDARYAAAKRLLDIQTIEYASAHHINDIDVLGPDGTIIYSTDMDDAMHIEHETHSMAALLREGRQGIYFTDVFRKVENGGPMSFMLASAPLKDLRGKLIGIIVFEINLNDFFDHIRETTGLGKSGETLLVKRVGNSVRYLTPMRTKAGPEFDKSLAYGDKRGVPGQLASSGQTGAGVSADYRGVEVVAAWRYVPGVAWGLVAKTDSVEAFAPIIELRNDLLTAGAIAFVLGAIFSLWLAHSMSRPIRTLQQAAEELGHGNLNFQVTITSNDEIGQLAETFNQMVVNLREMTASRDQIRHQANHDPLTGLPNRMLLEDRLQQALVEARRDGEIVAVMFLDLDGFKSVNDIHGHAAGDELLKQVAIRLLHCVRERDTVARMGGDEFVIVFSNVKGMHNIPLIAHKVIRSFERSFDIFGINIPARTSVGVSLYPDHSEETGELLQMADEAMYQAKRSGKNTYRIAAQQYIEIEENGIAESEAA